MIDCVDYYGTPTRKQSNPLKNNIDQWQKKPFKKPKKKKQKQLQWEKEGARDQHQLKYLSWCYSQDTMQTKLLKFRFCLYAKLFLPIKSKV